MAFGNPQEILTPEAKAFLSELERRFGPIRSKLLMRRADRAKELALGAVPKFLDETKSIREDSSWRVVLAPHDLEHRWVEITGPAEPKMMINALNSGAQVFMADLEDSLSPTWSNVIQGQACLMEAVRRTLSFTSPDGKSYRLKDRIATLLVRPRGWHLEEANMIVSGRAMSASLFDFGLYFFHNAKERLNRGTGPYFYLPKLESHLEARLWNDVFCFAQDYVGIPRGSVRATVLIETVLAAFEMEEILFELKEHSSGLNAGRWDYIFSVIKKFSSRSDIMLPDRSQITMTVPFMRAYTELLVRTCHKRGAHAIGGMAAFVPSRKDAAVNEMAITKVRADKERESRDGFDGTWVAHPDLVPIAHEVFDHALAGKFNQINQLREDVQVKAHDLLEICVPGGTLTEAGVRNNISVALQYLDNWLRGTGAVALNNLMEDVATAEIARSQLWQWLHHGAKIDNETFSPAIYKKICGEEVNKLGGINHGKMRDVVELLDGLVLNASFEEFLTLPAYRKL